MEACGRALDTHRPDARATPPDRRATHPRRCSHGRERPLGDLIGRRFVPASSLLPRWAWRLSRDRSGRMPFYTPALLACRRSCSYLSDQNVQVGHCSKGTFPSSTWCSFIASRKSRTNSCCRLMVSRRVTSTFTNTLHLRVQGAEPDSRIGAAAAPPTPPGSSAGAGD